jgi:hypothetical protein
MTKRERDREKTGGTHLKANNVRGIVEQLFNYPLFSIIPLQLGQGALGMGGHVRIS